MSDNDTAKTHLSRLGVNPVVIALLEEKADRHGVTIRELVRWVLSDYVRPDTTRPGT